MNAIHAMKNLLASAALLVGVGSAHALVASTNYTYQFSGNCIDCAAASEESSGPYGVTGTLVLRQTGSANEVVSFMYEGSNLVGPFSLVEYRDDASWFGVIDGAVVSGFDGGHVAPDWYVQLMFGAPFFEMFFVADGSTGQWSLCAPGRWEINGTSAVCNGPTNPWNQTTADIGDQAKINGVGGPYDVPEPGSLALLGLGLLGLAAVRKRKM